MTLLSWTIELVSRLLEMKRKITKYMLGVKVKLQHKKRVTIRKYVGRLLVLVTRHTQMIERVLRLSEMNLKLTK